MPSNIYHARKELMLSLVIFVSFLLLGVLLSFLDDNFIVATLGRNYVNMTLNNIANGTPTDVYNTTNEFTMFWMIAFNNLKVTFNIFKFGVFPIVGPSYILMNNGLMVGAP